MLIAYAWAPGVGSEPGVGWDLSHELAKRNDVIVVTRPNESGEDPVPGTGVSVITISGSEGRRAAPGRQWERELDYLRWLYTAFTRAVNNLYLVNFSKDFFGET